MAKKEIIEDKKLSKFEKMLQMVEDEKKLARKSGEPNLIARPGGFFDSGRDAYYFTGIMAIDFNICGRKKGVVNTIWGENQFGKSTLEFAIIEGLQLTIPDLVTAYFDTEQTIDDVFLDRFPYLDKSKIFLFRFTQLEAIMDKMRELTAEKMVDLLVWDSYDSSVSKTSMEKSYENDNQQTMSKVSILAPAMNEIQGNIKKHGIFFDILQQVRQGFNSRFQAYTKRAGGNTLLHAPSTVLKLSYIQENSELDKDTNKPIIRYVKIVNEKSKVSKPYKVTGTYINTDVEKGGAIDKFKELVDFAILNNVIQGKGWYSFINSDGELVKVQGKEKIVTALKNDIDLFTFIKFQTYIRGLQHDMLISRFDHLLDLLEAENKAIKKHKVKRMKLIEREDRLNPNDFTEYKFDRTKYTAESSLLMMFPIEPDFEVDEDYKNGEQIYKITVDYLENTNKFED